MQLTRAEQTEALQICCNARPILPDYWLVGRSGWDKSRGSQNLTLGLKKQQALGEWNLERAEWPLTPGQHNGTRGLRISCSVVFSETMPSPSGFLCPFEFRYNCQSCWERNWIFPRIGILLQTILVANAKYLRMVWFWIGTEEPLVLQKTYLFVAMIKWSKILVFLSLSLTCDDAMNERPSKYNLLNSFLTHTHFNFSLCLKAVSLLWKPISGIGSTFLKPLASL